MITKRVSIDQALREAPDWAVKRIMQKHQQARVGQAQLQQKLKDSAEFQRRSMMSASERGRDAVERMVPKVMERKGISEDAARTEVQQMQEKLERMHGGE